MKLKRIIAMLLLIATLALAACATNTGVATDTENDSDVVQKFIGKDELSDYKIIVSESISDEEKAELNKLATKIYSKYGFMLTVNEDYTEATEKEILIGDVKRDATQSIKKGIKYDDYTVTMSGSKLVILGGNSAATTLAITEFAKIVDENAGGDVFFDHQKNTLEYKHTYPKDDITINGASVSEYTIMYAKGESNRGLTLANALQKAIISVCGVEVKITAYTSDIEGNVIYFGGAATTSTLRAGDGVIYVTGATENDFFFAAQTLIERITESTDGKVTVEAEEALSYTFADLDLSKWGLSAEKITFMSYNLQNAGNGSTTKSKYQKLAAIVDLKNPDFLAVQECLTSGSASENLVSCLRDSSKYAAINSMGINQAVIYNKEKFTFLEKGIEEIGKAEDKYGSAYDRTMMWTKFKSNATGAEFIVLSVHVDYVKTANAAQLKLIIDYMQTHFADLPAVLLGDYNLEEGALDTKLMASAGYTNCAKTATVKVNEFSATFPSKEIIIDFIFAKKMTAEYYETITTGNNPSDHRPVYAELYIS